MYWLKNSAICIALLTTTLPLEVGLDGLLCNSGVDTLELFLEFEGCANPNCASPAVKGPGGVIELCEGGGMGDFLGRTGECCTGFLVGWRMSSSSA